MRKHPVAVGITILLGIGVLFFVAVYLLGLWKNDRASFSLQGKIGVVPIEGIIADSNELVEQLRQFADDDGIKAVVLRIDSPGGAVAPSQEIYEATRELRKAKKVVASMGSVAASGGYLIACAADKIVANPGTITGSISAVMHFADVQELMKKVGVRASVVKSGKFKDIGSPLREMTEEEKRLLQSVVDDVYIQFLEVVAENRKIPIDDLSSIADGRIFSGRQALNLRLIDQLGGLQDAVVLAGRLSGIEGKPDTVYAVKKRTSFWKFLIEGMASVISSKMAGELWESGGAQYLFPQR